MLLDTFWTLHSVNYINKSRKNTKWCLKHEKYIWKLIAEIKKVIEKMSCAFSKATYCNCWNTYSKNNIPNNNNLVYWWRWSSFIIFNGLLYIIVFILILKAIISKVSKYIWKAGWKWIFIKFLSSREIKIQRD